MNTITETLAEFSERMSHIDKEWEHTVGRAYQGNSRAHFVFEGQSVFNESLGYRTTPNTRLGSKLNPLMVAVYLMAVEPKDYWWTGYATYGRKQAAKIAKYYNAELEENPYASEEGVWFHYSQMTWENIMRFVYDRHTGKFQEMFGEETNVYKSCISG